MRSFCLFIACVLVALVPFRTAHSSVGVPDLTLPWVTGEARVPRVVFRTFDSKTIGGKVSYHAYIPAAYGRSEARLPVLYWLHGTDGGIGGIRPSAKVFDDAIEAGKVPAMIVVFVNGLPRRLWADSKDGSSPVERVFITEVIPDVDKTFRTIATREGRILEGFSMGGYGAARLGFKYPSLFAGISILAGGPFDLELRGPRAQRNPLLREQLLRDVCGNDPDYFKAISPWFIAEGAAAALRDQKTAIRHVVGARDDTRDLNRQFHERMASVRIPHDYSELPDVGHDARALLVALGDRNGEFYRRALGHAGSESRR
ncbi:MAG: alpha/beta hydrolase-fold protein [Proteobacteria bacterium]|nr:alpha/beta hydrolase-fold protein [Pseudomonadota bacterium]